MRRIDYRRWVIWCIPWAWAVACGPGVAEGPLPRETDIDAARPDTEAPDGTAPAGPDSEAPDTQTIPERESGGAGSETGEQGTGGPTESATESESDTSGAVPDWCEDPLVENETVAAAADLLQGSRFVAMSHNCLLLRRDDAEGITTAVVFTSALGEEYEIGRAETLSSAAPVSLTCMADPSGGVAGAVVLMSGPPFPPLVEATPESDGFTPLPGSEALAGQALVGVARLIRTAGEGINRLCVYGRGLFCADESSDWQSWQEEIAPRPDAQINGLALLAAGSEWITLAVGTDGLIMAKIGGEWQHVDSGTHETLLTATSDDHHLYAAGRSGILVYGTLDETFQTTITDGDIVSLYWSHEDTLKGITSAGSLFEGRARDGEITLCPFAEIPGPLTESLSMPCYEEENYVILTPNALMGHYECALVVVI